jgi:putative addiction module component (TIGR02574 family)
MYLDLPAIQSAAMELPIEERLQLAQAIWDSIEESGVVPDPAVLAEAKRRDDEMSSGKDPGRSHDDVMNAIRKAIGCE